MTRAAASTFHSEEEEVREQSEYALLFYEPWKKATTAKLGSPLHRIYEVCSKMSFGLALPASLHSENVEDFRWGKKKIKVQTYTP